MRLHKCLTTNNLVLKIVVATLFIVLPIMGFLVGIQYHTISSKVNPQPITISDNTKDWKIYTSSINKFSFKIPKEFVVIENTDGIKIFLNQAALDKSKVCKPNPKEIEPMPCSPELLSIWYAETPRSSYLTGEEYVNKKMGGMGGTAPYLKVEGQNLSWIVGDASGLEYRPTIRAFAYDGDKIRFIQTNTYISPFQEYKHIKPGNKFDWQRLEELTYQILSTIKFSD